MNNRVIELRALWTGQRYAMHLALNYERVLSAHQRRALGYFRMGSHHHRALAWEAEAELIRLGGWDDAWPEEGGEAPPAERPAQ